MTFRPKSDNKKEKRLCLLFACAAILLILASGIIEKFGGLYQISAIVCGVISIEFYLKYVGSDYVYEAADDYFKIYKITGKKSICVSCLDYEMSLSHVVTSEEYVSRKDEFPKTNFNVNFCKNINPENFSVYFFEFDGKKCMMKFQPDEVFTDYINNKITEGWEKSEEVAENEY